MTEAGFMDKEKMDFMKIKLYKLEMRHHWKRPAKQIDIQFVMEEHAKDGWTYQRMDKNNWKHYYKRIPRLLGQFWRLIEGGNIIGR